MFALFEDDILTPCHGEPPEIYIDYDDETVKAIMVKIRNMMETERNETMSRIDAIMNYNTSVGCVIQ